MDDPEEIPTMTHRNLVPQFSKTDASPVFLVPGEDSVENEFYIVYYKEDLRIQGGRYIPPSPSKSIPYYLQADLNFLGHDKGLRFVANPTKECCFIFQPSLGLYGSSLLKDEASFYIKCPRHWKAHGYLYTSPNPDNQTAEIHSAHSKQQHNQNIFNLFNLKYITPPRHRWIACQFKVWT